MLSAFVGSRACGAGGVCHRSLRTDAGALQFRGTLAEPWSACRRVSGVPARQSAGAHAARWAVCQAAPHNSSDRAVELRASGVHALRWELFMWLAGMPPISARPMNGSPATSMRAALISMGSLLRREITKLKLRREAMKELLDARQKHLGLLDLQIHMSGCFAL